MSKTEISWIQIDFFDRRSCTASRVRRRLVRLNKIRHAVRRDSGRLAVPANWRAPGLSAGSSRIRRFRLWNADSETRSLRFKSAEKKEKSIPKNRLICERWSSCLKDLNAKFGWVHFDIGLCQSHMSPMNVLMCSMESTGSPERI